MHQGDYFKTSPLLVLERTKGWYLEGRVDLGTSNAVLWCDRPRKSHQCGFSPVLIPSTNFPLAFLFTLNSCLMLLKGKSHNEEASGQLPVKFTSSEICSQSPPKVRGLDITASMFPVIKIHKITKLMYMLLFQKPSINTVDPDSSSCCYECHKHYRPFTLISPYIS